MDDSLVTGYGRICMDCKVPGSNSRGYNSLRKSVVYKKTPAQLDKEKVTKYCRFCSKELLLGENWTESRKNKCDYICRSCRKLDKPSRELIKSNLNSLQSKLALNKRTAKPEKAKVKATKKIAHIVIQK